MADSKIDFSFENLHFSCEGDNDWVEKQLNNVLNRIPSLLTVHKKGENIVEEVIEVSEEDVKEVEKGNPSVADKAVKTYTSNKPKAVKVVKEKVRKEKKVKEPKAAKAPQEKTITEVENSDIVVVKRGRKPKSGVQPASKVKNPKTKVAKIKSIVEQVDSQISQFIIEKKATGNQVRKFLATAVFLAKTNDVSQLSTPMISRALKSYGIEKLQNASDCLNKNEKKGYVIKEGKEFVITENGYLSIG